MNKKILCLIGICTMLFSCTNGKTEISGTLSNVNADTLVVYSFPVGHRDAHKADTILTDHGAFAFNVGDSIVKQVLIYAKEGSVIDASKCISFLLLPDRPVTISGNMLDYTLGGDAFYEDCNRINAIGKDWALEMDSISTYCMELYAKGVSEDSIQQIIKPYQNRMQEEMQKIREAKNKFIADFPQKDASLYALMQLPLQDLEKGLSLIDETVKTGVMAPVYQSIKDTYEADMARMKAAERIQPGKMAPDFTLKDLKGNDFTLSSLKGRFVVLDFWGSWCGWCIKGFPDMKELYFKHKGKMEFVGIACNDKEQQWKDAVSKHELPWVNVINGTDNDVASAYAIQGFPTKIILDRDGYITKVFIGEDPNFYTFTDELLR